MTALRAICILPLVLAAPPWPFSNEKSAQHNHTHLTPPWWILAGIVPSGPPIDRGSYTSSSFSNLQQKRFGVSSNGTVENWARFTAATKALQPCIGSKEKQLGLEEDDFMHILGHALEDAWAKVKEVDPLLEVWTKERSPCQRTCMTHVLSWSLKTLWGTGDLLSRGGISSFTSALANSVRACYPGSRAIQADDVANRVSKHVAISLQQQLPAAAAEGGFAGRRLEHKPTCLEADKANADREKFVQNMEVAVETAAAIASSRSWGLMEAASRPCQQTCRRATVRQASETLWDTGLLSRGNADELTVTSVKGALLACLPNLESANAEELAGEALIGFLARSKVSSGAEDEAPMRSLLRAYSASAKGLPLAGAGQHVSQLLAAVAGAVSLAAVGVVLKLKAPRSSVQHGEVNAPLTEAVE